MQEAISIIFLIYTVVLGVFTVVWLQRKKRLPQSALPTISVVIAVRNEQENILHLLRDLSSQTYNVHEVIVVDDHSTDTTVAIAKAFAGDNSAVRIIRSHGEGKKSALSTGIETATGDVIVTTDGDCRVGPGWLNGIAQAMSDKQIMLGFGPVSITGGVGIFSKMQEIEFASLMGTAAVTARLGRPTMCNGANLAFRRSVFHELGGYNGHLHIPSGDDEFLMRAVEHKYPNGIRFLDDDQVIVTTSPQETFRAFFHQRIRWAGKWRHHHSFVTQLVALFVFGIQLSVVATYLSVATGQASMLLIYAWVGKVVMEAIFLFRVNIFLRNAWHWPGFILLELVYPLYVLSVGVISNFKSFEWKGRALKSIAR